MSYLRFFKGSWRTLIGRWVAVYKAVMTNTLSFVSESTNTRLRFNVKKFESFLMRTAYGPKNPQIVFFEELKATLMDPLLIGLDVILLSV